MYENYQKKDKFWILGVIFFILIIGLVIGTIYITKNNVKHYDEESNEEQVKNDIEEEPKNEEEQPPKTEEEVKPEPVLNFNIQQGKEITVSDSLDLVVYQNINGKQEKVNVTYQSSDTKIATIENNKVVAKKSGSVIITATTKEGYQVKVNLTIKEKDFLSLNIIDDYEMYIGDIFTLTASLNSNNKITQEKVTWSTSNKNIVTVDNGKITAKSKGTATITATNKNNLKTSIKVIVKEKPTKEEIKKDTLSLSITKTPTLDVDSTLTIKAYRNKNNNTIVEKVTWSSSNTSIAKVDANGTITALKAGTTTIKATSTDKLTASIEIKVIDKPYLTLNITGTKTLEIQTSYQLKAYKNYNGKKTEESVIWSSSNQKTVSVTQNGLIYAHEVGTATITATSSDGLKQTIQVKVPTPSNPKRNRNTIHFISTGNSDAILIESYGVFGLVDSSNPYNDGTLQSVSDKKRTVAQVINYLDGMGIKYLDFVVATHSHSDHIGGMVEIAKKYINSKTTYYYRTYTGSNDGQPSWDNEGYYKRAVAAVKAKGAKMVELTNKTPTYTYGNFKIKFVNTDADSKKAENYNSIGTLVQLGNKKIFLSADIENEDSNKIASSIGAVDVLKLNHHGHSGSTPEYISTLKPKYIVITHNELLQTAIAPVTFAKGNFNTQTYLTGNVSDAIRLNVTSTNCTFENSGNPVSVDETKWVQWLDKYIYLDKGKLFINQWLKWKEQWYYFDKYGFMATEWQYLNAEGGLNWFYFHPTEGNMLTGWQELEWSGGKNWFYFDKNKGTLLSGWQELEWSGGKDWFYFDPMNGYLIQDKCITLSGKTYCFTKDGVCNKGC